MVANAIAVPITVAIAIAIAVSITVTNAIAIAVSITVAIAIAKYLIVLLIFHDLFGILSDFNGLSEKSKNDILIENNNLSLYLKTMEQRTLLGYNKSQWKDLWYPYLNDYLIVNLM
jgi:hypothetical protein